MLQFIKKQTSSRTFLRLIPKLWKEVRKQAGVSLWEVRSSLWQSQDQSCKKCGFPHNAAIYKVLKTSENTQPSCPTRSPSARPSRHHSSVIVVPFPCSLHSSGPPPQTFLLWLSDSPFHFPLKILPYCKAQNSLPQTPGTARTGGRTPFSLAAASAPGEALTAPSWSITTAPSLRLRYSEPHSGFTGTQIGSSLPCLYSSVTPC